MYKTVILCGGKGVRLSEETVEIPKPMVKINNTPILLSIMHLYSKHNFNDFILCLGYKSEIIKEFFYNYHKNNSDIKVNLNNNNIEFLKKQEENISVSLIDTGLDSLTGDRISQIEEYIKEDLFLLTYGDGLCDININELVKFHKSHNKMVTLTAIQKKGKFGTIQTDNNTVTSFSEKPIDDDYINGGYFVCNKEIFSLLQKEDFAYILGKLAKQNELMCYKYSGNWECMDTINDKNNLEKMENEGNAFWKVWE